jgi:hypothetical protein
MNDELTMCPFKRSIAGPRGTVLLRRHDQHAKHCAEAIRRRDHPQWSRQRDDYRVGEAA